MIIAGVVPAVSAAAPPVPVTPVDGAAYEIGDTLTFAITFPDSSWSATQRLKVRLTTNSALDGSGRLTGGNLLTYPSGFGPNYSFTTYSLNQPTQPGTYYWQAYAESHSDYSGTLPLEVGPVRTLRVTAPAGATAFEPASGTRYRMSSGSSIGFRVSGQSSKFTGGTLRISRSSAMDANGRIGSEVDLGYLGASYGGTAGYTSASYTNIAGKPGTYYWQAVLTGYGLPDTPTPVQSFEITAPQGLGPDGVLRRDGIPAWAGTRGSWSFRINRSYGIPLDVSASWFEGITRVSGSRWGLTAAGTTAAIAGFRDGISTVGFSYSVPAGVLGVQSTWFVNDTKRKRTCKRVRGKRRCTTRSRTVKVPMEKDLVISRAVFWEQGPAYPLSSDYDLETVLIHEFGHMASDRNVHVYGCANSPMIVAAGPGEWWRSPTDWARGGCAQRANGTEGGKLRPAERRHFKHVSYLVDAPPPSRR